MKKKGNLWGLMGAVLLLGSGPAAVHAQNASDYTQQLREMDKALQMHQFYQYGQDLFYGALQAAQERRNQEQQTRYNALVLAQKGLACLEKKDWNGAIDNFTKSINTDATLAGAYKGRGAAYYAKSDYTRALADYDRTLLFDGTDAQAYDMRANIYFQRGDIDKALKDYNYSLRINPANALGFYNRANAYCQKGDYVRGRADLEAALRINPGIKEAQNALDTLNKKGL